MTSAPVPSTRASAVQIVRMCEALTLAGADVVLRCRQGDDMPDPLEPYGVRARFAVAGYEQPSGPGGFLLFADRLARAALSDEPDVVYGRHWPTLLRLVPSGIPLAYEVHEPAESRRSTAGQALLLRAPSLRLVVVVTEALQRHVRSRHARLEAVLVAPSAAAVPEQTLSRAALHCPPRVGYAGSLHPGKGAELIVALADRVPGVVFHVVGGEPDQVARLAGRAPRNLIVRGHIPHRHVTAFLDSVDIAVAPYGTAVAGGSGDDLAPWMSPLKLFEYLAHGLPVVATDHPVLREAVVDGVHALLRPPDPDCWAETLTLLVGDGTLRARLGAEGRALVEARHTWARRATHVLSALDRVVP